MYTMLAKAKYYKKKELNVKIQLFWLKITDDGIELIAENLRKENISTRFIIIIITVNILISECEIDYFKVFAYIGKSKISPNFLTISSVSTICAKIVCCLTMN